MQLVVQSSKYEGKALLFTCIVQQVPCQTINLPVHQKGLLDCKQKLSDTKLQLLVCMAQPCYRESSLQL